MKRGQLTIFIILAIVILGAATFYFTIGKNLSVLNPEQQKVFDFTQNCIDESAKDVVYSVGLGGGYILPPEISSDLGFPYYYYNNQNYMPSKIRIEEEMSNFIGERILNCTSDFKGFSDLKIESANPLSKASIRDEKVVFSIDFPISIETDSGTSELKNFNSEVSVRFGIVYDSVAELMQEQMSHAGVCMNCALDIALKNDLYVDMQDYGNETILFDFRDENSKINNETFEYVFLNKY